MRLRVTSQEGGRYDQTTQKREDRKVRDREIRKETSEYDSNGDSENNLNKERSNQMKSLFNRQFDTLLRVHTFSEKHPELFSLPSLAGKMFATVANAIPALSKYAGSQEAGLALAREGVNSKAEARQNLRDCMEGIVRTARSMGREQPTIRGKFRMPRRVGNRSLIDAANGFMENLPPMKDVFVEHEMSPDFVQELQDAIDRFQAAIVDHGKKKGVHKDATLSMEKTMERAMDAVYRLAGIVPNKLKKDAVTLGEWENARRVTTARVSKPPES